MTSWLLFAMWSIWLVDLWSMWSLRHAKPPNLWLPSHGKARFSVKSDEFDEKFLEHQTNENFAWRLFSVWKCCFSPYYQLRPSRHRRMTPKEVRLRELITSGRQNAKILTFSLEGKFTSYPDDYCQFDDDWTKCCTKSKWETLRFSWQADKRLQSNAIFMQCKNNDYGGLF